MNRDFSQKAPLQNQANMLASKGRFGDSMLVHMNPTEVDVLRRMTPGGQLTINPDTGQPEAFLPLVLGLAGALAGGAATTGILGTLGAVGAGAIGTGLGTTIETGSLKEGLKAGLISGVLGGVAGKLFQGADTVASAGATGNVASEAGKAVLTQPPVPTTVLAQGGSQASQQIGQTLAGSVAPQVTQSVAPQIASGAGAESLKQLTTELAQQGATQPNAITNMLTSPKLIESATAGATTGLTGQALTDQFNMMNIDSGPMLDEDDEDFFVPVQARDRGVQFAGADIGGTGEFDYFSEPFGFDPLPPVGVKEGGMISGAARKFRNGGPIEEGMFVSGNANSFVPTPSFNIPDYFRGPNAVGTNLDDMITEQVTEQIYTPRSQQMPSTSVSNIRGAGNVDFVDYNQRLLGDPTQTRDVTRRMTEDEIAARDAELAVMQAEEAANAAALTQPDVQLNPLDFMSEGMGDRFNFNPFTGRSDPYAAARAAGRTNATPTEDTPSYVGLMGNTIDPYQKMLDRQAQTSGVTANFVGYGGDGMGMMGMPAFDPSMPAMDFAAPTDTGFTPIQSVGATQPQFDPFAGMDFRGGRGGFNFGGMGGMSMGM